MGEDHEGLPIGEGGDGLLPPTQRTKRALIRCGRRFKRPQDQREHRAVPSNRHLSPPAEW